MVEMYMYVLVFSTNEDIYMILHCQIWSQLETWFMYGM